MTLISHLSWSADAVHDLPIEGRIDQVSRSQAIAVIAHRRQRDKLGVRYINHPAEVAYRFDPIDETAEHCAAWLHDVLEDTSVGRATLELANIHPEIIDIVGLLTRRKGQGDEYYERIRENPVALRVKYADITHNTDPSRTAGLTLADREHLDAKYRRALDLLGMPWPDHFMVGQVGGTIVGNPAIYEFG